MGPAFDDDCAWIRLGPSEYDLLMNGSLYVPVHGETYDADAYQLGDNHSVYLCTSFQRNYTHWITETLRVDTVGTYTL